MARFDLIIRDASVVRPQSEDIERLDIGIHDGRVAELGSLSASSATEVFDADGLLAFPGAVDAHQHWGIYSPLAGGHAHRSQAAAQGGVTTGLTYMRTGQYYLNSSGPYADVFPEGTGETAENARTIDYAFHLAPMMREHIDEIPLRSSTTSA